MERLDFNWDEVHDVAEQLERIQREKLVEAIDKLVDYPEADPWRSNSIKLKVGNRNRIHFDSLSKQLFRKLVKRG